MNSEVTSPANPLSQLSLSIIAFIAVLPVLLFSVSFLILEAGFILGIELGGIFSQTVMLLITAGLSAIFVKSLNQLLNFPKDLNFSLFKISDLAIALALMGYIFYRFYLYHYVTPSASVLYYIFYDYVRLLGDTGFYRPPLPADNPAGTWHSMLTYNPTVGAAAAALHSGEGVEGYRSSFALLTAIVNIGAIAWLGLFSRHTMGLFFPGIAIGFSAFAFLEKAGLAQQVAYIGSHDLPMFYFSAATVCLSLLACRGLAQRKSSDLFTLAIINIGIIALGVSVRPYLMALALTAGFFSLYLLYLAYQRHQTTESNTDLLSKLKENTQGLIIGSMVLFAGAYWFLVLIVKYQTPVVYSHSTQFKNLSNFSDAFTEQFNRLVSVLVNDSAGYNWFAHIHQYIAIAAVVITVLAIILHRGDKRFLPISILFALLVSIPLLTQTGTHWKSFYTVMIVMYMFFPVLAIGCLLYKDSNQFIDIRWYKLLISAAFLGIVSLNLMLPDESFDKLVTNDQAFRQQTAALKRDGEKMLVLRGGEPGGDGQTLFDRYYYWDNVFFFGDIDKAFLESAPNLQDFACLLKSRNIGLIFNPTYLSMPNHSGKVAYDGIINLIKQNESVFVPAVERQDGYQGVVYQVNYADGTTTDCALAKRLPNILVEQ